MFHLYDNGFTVTFDNGYTASVRWGERNACLSLISDDVVAVNAEVACWLDDNSLSGNRQFIELPDWLDTDTCGQIAGYVSPSDVNDFLRWVENLPADEDEELLEFQAEQAYARDVMLEQQEYEDFENWMGGGEDW